ncbi:hypothetical protein [Hugenholtzia roseola]|uniref:hypothetical protein n=1 Tax=Hugenholtzia roseola TaxID=1002 RepID=UPI0013782568|nr:hypothetical protein [Hugenholtzia roseola]
MVVYNKLGSAFRTLRLQEGESVSVELEGDVGVKPWHFNDNINSAGDSSVIIFNELLCLSEVDRDDKYRGTFDFRNYDNYTPELVQQRKFTLYYTFTEEHYAQAQPCE